MYFTHRDKQVLMYSRHREKKDAKVENERRKSRRKFIMPVDVYNSMIDIYLEHLGKDSRILKAPIQPRKFDDPHNSEIDKKMLVLLSQNIDKFTFLGKTISLFYEVELPYISLQCGNERISTSVWNIGTSYLPAGSLLFKFEKDWKEPTNQGLINGWILYLETWTPSINYTLPRQLRNTIKCMMMLTLNDGHGIPLRPSLLNKLPKEMLYNIFRFLSW